MFPAGPVLLSFVLAADGGKPAETRPPEPPQQEPSRAGPSLLVESSEVPPPASPLTFTLGARAELRSGHPLEGLAVTTNPDAATTDLEINPLGALKFTFPAGSVAVAYEPRIFIIASQANQKVYYLHRGRLSFEDRPAARWRLYVNSRTSYGEYDYNPLSGLQGAQPGTGAPRTPAGGPPAPPVLGTAPDQRFVKILDFEASGGAVYDAARNLEWISSLGYRANGGADTAARTSVPLQRGPIGSTGPRWSIGPLDSLLTLVDFSHVRFSNGPRSTLVNLTSNWTHVWNPGLETDLLGGIGWFNSSDVPGQAPFSDYKPVGGFALRQVLAGRKARLRNEIQVIAAPATDPLAGTVSERVRGYLSSALTLRERLVLSLTGEVGQTIGLAQRDARIEARVSYAFAPQLAVALGARVAWLESYNLPGNKGFGWLGFVSVATYFGTGQ